MKWILLAHEKDSLNYRNESERTFRCDLKQASSVYPLKRKKKFLAQKSTTLDFYFKWFVFSNMYVTYWCFPISLVFFFLPKSLHYPPPQFVRTEDWELHFRKLDPPLLQTLMIPGRLCFTRWTMSVNGLVS